MKTTKATIIVGLLFISGLAYAANSYNAIIKSNFTVKEATQEDPISNVIAEVTGSDSATDGTQVSGASTLVSGYNYNNRDFFTWGGTIGGHGVLNNSFELVYDAGENNIWSVSSSDVVSVSSSYHYTANVYWYLSDDLISWELIGSLPGYLSYGQEAQKISFSNVKKRYLKINHDIQPLNSYKLSYASYQNIDLKILTSDF